MKNNIKNILIIAVTFLFFGYVVFADPSGKPIDPNVDLPITQLNSTQTKSGALIVNKFLVGDWKDSKGNFVVMNSLGMLGIKETTSSINNMSEYLEVESGKVRLSELSVPNVDVCADSKGTLVQCQTTIFSHSGDDTKPYETYSFKVPAGATKLIVELYGAGGAGYSMNRNDWSPDETNHPACSQTGQYVCDNGGSAIFYDSNGKDEILRALGGKSATSKHVGGAGGSYSISGSSKIDTIIEKKEGETGGNGENGGSPDTSKTFKCDITYNATIGGYGGQGGVGGRAGHGGLTPGGPGGKGGASILDLSFDDRCSGYGNNTFNGKGFLSENAANGQFGAGGAGGGGMGGYSDRGGSIERIGTNPTEYADKDSLCSTGGTCPKADQGYAGGGGGGYIKAVIKGVKGGEVYNIKLSHGGKVQGWTEDKGQAWCYFMQKYSCFGGSYSGNGSGAYAKITVN
ncbi:hypothetical protein IT400_02265 [Candidatus Nomurabacteria bacterium]|nr:hypothetical protein [Candidatus Nomurabacteria bacterium]